MPRTELCLRTGAVAMLALLCLPTPLVPLGKPLGSADTFPCSVPGLLEETRGGVSRDQRLVGKLENGAKNLRGAEGSHTTTRDLVVAQVQEHFLGLLLHPALLPRVLDRQILIQVSQGQVGDGTE